MLLPGPGGPATPKNPKNPSRPVEIPRKENRLNQQPQKAFALIYTVHIPTSLRFITFTSSMESFLSLFLPQPNSLLLKYEAFNCFSNKVILPFIGRTKIQIKIESLILPVENKDFSSLAFSWSIYFRRLLILSTFSSLLVSIPLKTKQAYCQL